ncbi:MAG: hypothetical protein WDN28_05445 [Chthoniobacter sp.]
MNFAPTRPLRIRPQAAAPQRAGYEVLAQRIARVLATTAYQ